MALDFTKPATSDNYSSGFVPNIQANQVALAQMLDSGVVSITGTPPTYAKRINRTSGLFEEYSGSSWGVFSMGYTRKAGDAMSGGIEFIPVNQLVANGTNGSLQVGFLSSAITSTTDAFLFWAGSAQPLVSAFGGSNGSVVLAARNVSGAAVVLATGGANRVIVNSGGDVGVGGAPTAKFDVIGAQMNLRNSAGLAALGEFAGNGNTAGSASLAVGQDGSGVAYLLNRAASALLIGTSGATRIHVAAGGDVGVGGSPNSYGAGYTSLTLNNSTAGVLDFNVSAVRQGSLFANASECRLSSVTAIPLTFFTSNVERLRLDAASGHVTPGANNAQTLGSTGLRWSTVNSVLGNYSGALTALSFDSAASTDLLLRPAGTLRATLTAAGLLQLPAGNVNGGLQLPNAANSSASVLDWYEEGTFSPTATGSSVAGTTSYGVQQGRFVRIGRLVWVYINLEWGTHTGSGDVRINGLPYAAALYQGSMRAVPGATGLTFDAWRGDVSIGQTYITLRGNNQNSGSNSTRAVVNNDQWEITGFYEV